MHTARFNFVESLHEILCCSLLLDFLQVIEKLVNKEAEGIIMNNKTGIVIKNKKYSIEII